MSTMSPVHTDGRGPGGGDEKASHRQRRRPFPALYRSPAAVSRDPRPANRAGATKRRSAGMAD